jgi:hypothetical protein
MGKLDVTHEFLPLLHFTSVMPCHDSVLIQIFNLTFQNEHALRFKKTLELKNTGVKCSSYLRWKTIREENFSNPGG